MNDTQLANPNPLGGQLAIANKNELATAGAAANAKALVEAKFVMAAHRPRDLMAARTRILNACKRPQFAETAWYSKPVGGGNKVRGPSIRFAEEAIRAMTNITVLVNVLYEDAEKRVLNLDVVDLESNTSYGDTVTINKTVERKQSKDREVLGKRENSSGETVYIVAATEDEIAIKTNAAKSKVIRNSGLRLIPQDFIEEAEEEVRRTLESGGSDPLAQVKKIVDAFAKINVGSADLAVYLGHAIEKVNPAEVADLREVLAAIKDGESKWSDYVDGGKKVKATVPNFEKAKEPPLEQQEEKQWGIDSETDQPIEVIPPKKK